jgi:hypothetical protein
LSSRFKPIGKESFDQDARSQLDKLLSNIKDINPYDLDRKATQQLRDCISE